MIKKKRHNDEMKQINRIISIGANCISMDFSKYLGIRERGPIDNFNRFNIWKSPLLFTKNCRNVLLNSNYKKRCATDFEIKSYHFFKEVYIFEKGYSIVHNNFESDKFRKQLSLRISKFYKYYKKSLKNDTLWFVYSLDFDDSKITEKDLILIKNELPEHVSEHLICLGIRAKNPLFEKYFRYYIEMESEECYRWCDKSQGIEIANILEKKYKIKINY